RSSTDCRPSGDDSSASCSQSRLPRHWLLGPTVRCASSRANPSSPRPSAICGHAGLPSFVASTTAGWRLTTIPPSAPCAVSPLAVRIICLPAPMPAAPAIYSLIDSAKLNGLNPQHYLADVLARIADHPARRIAELLPWNWRPLDATLAAA